MEGGEAGGGGGRGRVDMAEEDDEDEEALLRWSSALDFDKYETFWRSAATSTSGVAAVPTSWLEYMEALGGAGTGGWQNGA